MSANVKDASINGLQGVKICLLFVLNVKVLIGIGKENDSSKNMWCVS